MTAAAAAANMYQNKFTAAASSQQHQQQFEMFRPSTIAAAGPNRFQPSGGGQPVVPVRSPSPAPSAHSNAPHTPKPATGCNTVHNLYTIYNTSPMILNKITPFIV